MSTPYTLTVYYSYAHVDQQFREQLDKHLILLRREGIVDEWHDRKIEAGADWSSEISDHLERADVILLLVSVDFLASDYCYQIELKRAMERHDAGDARVIPIILRPCEWQNAAFGKLQALPQEGKPITAWDDQDEAFTSVASTLRALATRDPYISESVTPDLDGLPGLFHQTPATSYPPPPSFESSGYFLRKRIKAGIGAGIVVIAILAALLLEIPRFRAALNDLVPSVAAFPVTLRRTVVSALCLIGTATFASGRIRESRLIPGGSLQLDRDKPNHLVGRENEVAIISELCRDSLLVHLVGEAGSGKTALVRAGLIRALRRTGKVVPVYMNIYGQDWYKGPKCSLAEALWDAMSKKQRSQLEMKGRYDPGHVVSHLTAFRTTTGILPLLIFDQFDDYQLRHGARFINQKRKTWLSVGELTRVNAFWRDIKQLVQSDLIHCLIVTRADMADGLISTQFVEPQVYRLTRLPAHHTKDILDRIAMSENNTVLFPESGWEKLRERLARDLDEEGTILPARLKLALLGLPRLRALTVAAYESYGGLSALEAGYIEWHIREAARASNGLTDADVRGLCLKMTDLEALKTIEKTQTELCAGIPST